MLESAEIGHKIAKGVYARQVPKLREALLNAQYDLAQGKRGPLLILFSGIEGGGRSETANTLNEWMDPRHIRTVAFGARTEDERSRPPAWRYWRVLPPRGRIGILMNAWYTEALSAHYAGHINRERLEFQLENIRHVERMLADEGYSILKFWIHLSKDAAKERLRELAKAKDRHWELTPDLVERSRMYSKSHNVWEEVLRESSTAEAPWYVVEGADERYRNLTVGRIILDTMNNMNAARAHVHVSRGAAPPPAVIDNVRLIRDLDLSKKLTDAEYDKAMPRWQGKLAALTRHKRFRKHALVLVFEGADPRAQSAASPARSTAAIHHRADRRAHRRREAVPVPWRFWRNMPGRGGITIFDRSWYGHVLVERVEGFAAEYDWLRAYDEINQFEEQLTETTSWCASSGCRSARPSS